MRQDFEPRRPRILVSQQGCIPLYRKSFFQRLNALGSIDYVVAHGAAPSGTNLILARPPFDFPNIAVKNHEISFFGISFIWQPIVRRAMRGEFDGAVLGDEVKFLSSLVITLALRLRRRPVLLWGFGFHQNKGSTAFPQRVITALAGFYKKIFYRLVSGYLAYTEGGRQALLRLPGPPRRIVVLRNTIDTEREAEFRAIVAAESIEIAFQELRVRPRSVKLLYFGRLLPAKCVDLLIEYAERSARAGRDIDIIVFGEGPEEGRLRRLSSHLSNVVFHSHNDLLLARALRVSIAVVIPGFLGLAINHSFAHGVPVLSRLGQPHSPEVEYLEDGINGMLLPEAPAAFFAALDAFVDNQDQQRRLSEGAERAALQIDMDYMVASFHGLVSEFIAAPTSTAE